MQAPADGFPNGVVLFFEELEPPSEGADAGMPYCRVKMEFYCHMPYDLAGSDRPTIVPVSVGFRYPPSPFCPYEQSTISACRNYS